MLPEPQPPILPGHQAILSLTSSHGGQNSDYEELMTERRDMQQPRSDEPGLKRPDEAIKDLEPDVGESEAVMGGFKVPGIDGESQDDTYKGHLK